MKERYNCPEVILLSNGKEFDHSDEVKELIQKYDFQLNSQPITEVLGDAKNKQLDGYKLSDGTQVETEFTFISLGMIIYNELAKSLVQISIHEDLFLRISLEKVLLKTYLWLGT